MVAHRDWCRVIHGIQTGDLRNLFNPENIFVSKEGGGAGNNWASGYYQGEQVQDTLLDMMGEWGVWVGGWLGVSLSALSDCSIDRNSSDNLVDA